MLNHVNNTETLPLDPVGTFVNARRVSCVFCMGCTGVSTLLVFLLRPLVHQWKYVEELVCFGLVCKKDLEALALAFKGKQKSPFPFPILASANLFASDVEAESAVPFRLRLCGLVARQLICVIYSVHQTERVVGVVFL